MAAIPAAICWWDCRHFNPATNAILGGYLGYDVRNTGKTTFNQLGAGVEGVWSGFEAHLNGYLPIGDTRQTVDRASFTNSSSTSSTTSTPSGDPRFQGNNLVFGLAQTTTLTTLTNSFNFRRDQVALGGLDAEAGVKLLSWKPDGDLRSYLGLYYYTGSNISGFVGVRGRLVARVNQYASVGLSVQGDSEFGTTAAVTVGLTFPGVSNHSAPENAANWARMGDSVNRINTVAVTERTATSSSSTTTTSTSTSNTIEAARNPATGQPWVFEHVVLGGAGGDGTYENPFSTVANGLTAVPGDGNGIVYVQPGTNPGIPAFPIKDNVQVLSTGPVQTIPTVQAGTLQLPLSGTLPRVTNTVTMGNNTVLSGFAVTPPTGSTAILANGVQNVTIRDNQAQANGNNIPVIRLQNVTGTATVNNNTITANGTSSAYPVGADGIEVDLSNTTLANLLLTNNRVTVAATGNNTDAIGIFPTNNSVIMAMSISGNTLTISAANSFGVYVYPQTNSLITTATLANNTITTGGNGSYGIDLRPDTSRLSTVTLSGNTITTTGTGADAIFFDSTNNGSISTLNIANNTITASGTNSHGMHMETNQPATAPLQITIANNTLKQTGSYGIFLDTYGATQAAATITNNTVTNATDVGIYVVANNTSQLRTIIDSNQVSNVQLGGIAQVGITVDTADTAQLFGSITNNRVANTNALGNSNRVEYRAQTNNIGVPNNNNICVRFLNNSASQTGYWLANFSPVGTIRVEPFTGNTGGTPPQPTTNGVVANILNVAAGVCGF
jgi:hypothetical protein